MNLQFANLAHHGYFMLLASVFLETIGFPVPAAIALIFAGGASAHGSLNGFVALAGALCVMLSGDLLMFLLGRYTGWWLLGLLCRLTLNPESCILRSADSFYKRGRRLLLFAKFLPGINTMAPPLAGSMNMRWTQFIGLDAVGASFYIGAYWSLGFLFADAVGAITRSMQAFSRAVEALIAAAVLLYLAYLVSKWTSGGALCLVPRVRPADVARQVSSQAAIILDVRSHGYYDQKATRIQGSRRLDPNALHRQTFEAPANGQLVFLYCTCVGDATSSRVAKELMERGIRVAVIKGGLRAWKKAGLPLESVPPQEVAPLPAFET